MTIDLDALERIAQAQEAAYARMLDIGEGVGGLGVHRPDMFKDLIAWDDLSENEHADTVLALIARVRELEAIVNDGGNQAAKYWTRLNAAEQERDRYRELTRRTELQCQDAETEASRYREAIEAVRKYIHSDKGIDLSEMAPGGIILGILDSALNDKEAEK